MALFSKGEQAQKTRERPLPGLRAIPSDAAISIIGPGMVVTGDMVSEGIVRIEGEVRGTIRAGKAVVLGPAGRVDGDIVTADAVIGGYVSGTIVAHNRLELQSTSVVEGEIQAKPQHLKVDEGARFHGGVRMVEAGTSDLVVTASAALPPAADHRVTASSTHYPLVSQGHGDPRTAAQDDESSEALVVA
jgi:cytoskeletal protein CcmA (bactofilin family)